MFPRALMGCLLWVVREDGLRVESVSQVMGVRERSSRNNMGESFKVRRAWSDWEKRLVCLE